MSGEGPLFSVIVPAYNAACTIERCVVSILQQTCADLELIVADDCSSDDTLALVADVRDPRIVLLSAERNEGPSAARNRALRQARGDFIVFVDADDWLDPEFLSRAREALEGDRVLDFVATRYRVVTSNGSMVDRQDYPGGDPLRAFLEDRIVSSVWAKVFKRSLIEEHAIRFVDARYMEDSVFNTAYLSRARAGLLLDAPLYNFDRRSNSATSGVFAIELLEATQRSLRLTRHALGPCASRYEDALRAREFRMLALNSIMRLARDRLKGSADRQTVRAARKYLWTHVGLVRVLRDRTIRLREKGAYFLFLLSPSSALGILASRLKRSF